MFFIYVILDMLDHNHVNVWFFYTMEQICKFFNHFYYYFGQLLMIFVNMNESSYKS